MSSRDGEREWQSSPLPSGGRFLVKETHSQVSKVTRLIKDEPAVGNKLRAGEEGIETKPQGGWGRPLWRGYVWAERSTGRLWQAEAIRRAFQARSTAGGRTGLDECEEQRRGLGLDWMPSSNWGSLLCRQRSV